ncbi:hypothetical protein Tco_0770459 [Tanacetum coccineum]|uniref:Reverse transcriptase domain-containing protein n=1 Tax=Tanacetum coccineum TaxID=301880 RepID=A0ABQ4ZCB2_9ASTR
MISMTLRLVFPPRRGVTELVIQSHWLLEEVSSLISLNRGSFDVIAGMDWLSKRKFGVVCYEKVVRIRWKVMSCKTRVSYDLVIFREEHQCRLLGRGAWSSFEVSVRITEEGEVVTYLRFIANFSKIVKPLTSLTERNQKYEWGAEREEAFQTLKNDLSQSEVFKQENVLAERLHGLDPQMERKRDESVYFMDWIWVLLVGSVMDEAHASRSLVLWVEIGDISLTRLELVQETTDKVVFAIEGRNAFWKEGLRLPEELIYVHDTFHVSNLKNMLADASLHVPLDEIKVEKTLCFVEEPVENSDCEVKSFDVIMGIDWLSKRKFVIICHEKVVKIPLEGSRKLRVQGERTLGVAKALMNAKVEFRIDLVHEATSVAKSPYRLAPLEMQELSEQL